MRKLDVCCYCGKPKHGPRLAAACSGQRAARSYSRDDGVWRRRFNPKRPCPYRHLIAFFRFVVVHVVQAIILPPRRRIVAGVCTIVPAAIYTILCVFPQIAGFATVKGAWSGLKVGKLPDLGHEIGARGARGIQFVI
jgi:hypothetical protein